MLNVDLVSLHAQEDEAIRLSSDRRGAGLAAAHLTGVKLSRADLAPTPLY